jgi:hypothetical protein
LQALEITYQPALFSPSTLKLNMQIPTAILKDLQAERDRQDTLYGTKRLETEEAVSIIMEQLLQLQRAAKRDCPQQAYRQGIQVAAVAVKYLEGLPDGYTFRRPTLD